MKKINEYGQVFEEKEVTPSVKAPETPQKEVVKKAKKQDEQEPIQ